MENEMVQNKEWLEAQKIEISIDMFAAAKKHLQFLEAVHQNQWLHDGIILERAIYRYNACWLPLLAKYSESSSICEGPLVPPLDCEWVWHCHRLNPVRYMSDCEQFYGRLLDNSGIVSSATGGCTLQTEALWNSLYPMESYELDVDNIVLEQKDISALEKCTTYDLFSAVKRQISFYYELLNGHVDNDIIVKEAVGRYKAFLYLIKRNQEKSIDLFSVPTYDIDLMWHTHQLNPSSYHKDLKKIFGNILQHDDTDSDKSEGSKLNTGFSRTTVQWEETFGQSYWKATEETTTVVVAAEKYSAGARCLVMDTEKHDGGARCLAMDTEKHGGSARCLAMDIDKHGGGARCLAKTSEKKSARCIPVVAEKKSAKCIPVVAEKKSARCIPVVAAKKSSKCAGAEQKSSKCSDAVIGAEKKSARCIPLVAAKKSSKCAGAVVATEKKSARCAVMAVEKKSAKCAVMTAEKKSAKCVVMAVEKKSAKSAVMAAEKKSAKCAVMTAEKKSAKCAVMAAEKSAKCAVVAAEKKSAKCAVLAVEMKSARCAVVTAQKKNARYAVVAEKKSAKCAVLAVEKKSAKCAVVATEKNRARCAVVEVEKNGGCGNMMMNNADGNVPLGDAVNGIVAA